MTINYLIWYQEKHKCVFCGFLNAGVRCEAAHVESRRPQEATPLLWWHLRKTVITRTGPGAPPQGVAPQLYNWNSVEGNYLPPPPPSSHALPSPSPRDSACAWLANLPVHSLPPSFTWCTGYEGQNLRDEGLSICCIILAPPLPPPYATHCRQQCWGSGYGTGTACGWASRFRIH